MQKPKIKITVTRPQRPCGCHRGHKPGDSFDFRHGARQAVPNGNARCFSLYRHSALRRFNSRCRTRHSSILLPDVDTINVFKVEVVKDE